MSDCELLDALPEGNNIEEDGEDVAIIDITDNTHSSW